MPVNFHRSLFPYAIIQVTVPVVSHTFHSQISQVSYSSILPYPIRYVECCLRVVKDNKRDVCTAFFSNCKPVQPSAAVQIGYSFSIMNDKQCARGIIVCYV